MDGGSVNDQLHVCDICDVYFLVFPLIFVVVCEWFWRFLSNLSPYVHIWPVYDWKL